MSEMECVEFARVSAVQHTAHTACVFAGGLAYQTRPLLLRPIMSNQISGTGPHILQYILVFTSFFSACCSSSFLEMWASGGSTPPLPSLHPSANPSGRSASSAGVV